MICAFGNIVKFIHRLNCPPEWDVAIVLNSLRRLSLISKSETREEIKNITKPLICTQITYTSIEQNERMDEKNNLNTNPI